MASNKQPIYKQYPPTGTPMYSVTIQPDGSIKVKKDDWLSKYSMCLHGVPDVLHEYGRWNSALGRPTEIQFKDIIDEGETIYHIPTFDEKPSSKPPKKGPGLYDERKLAEFIHNQAGISRSWAKKMSAAMNIIRGGSGLFALTLEVVGVVSAGGLTALFAGIAGATASTVGSAAAFWNAASFHHQAEAMVGYCYGFTAWNYKHHRPAPSQYMGWSKPGAKEQFKKAVNQAFLDGPKFAKTIHPDIDVARVGVATKFPNPRDFCRAVARDVHDTITEPNMKLLFYDLLVRDDCKCKYPK